MKQTSWASQTQQASFEELGNMKAQMWYILTMDYYSAIKRCNITIFNNMERS